MQPRVLITGASGFVGYHLIRAALDRGLDVVGGVRPSSRIDHLSGLPIRTLNLDLQNRLELCRILKDGQFDYIVHAAGVTKAPDEAGYHSVNAMCTRTLAEAAADALPGLRKLVFLSSLAALGPLDGPGGRITESTAPHPVTAYGRSKLQAEQWLEVTGLPWMILRPTAVYGPRDKDIFIMFRLVAKGWEPYMGRVSQTLSFVYARDLADLTVTAMLSGLSRRTYNVSDGQGYDRYALAGYAARELEVTPYRFHVPMPAVRGVAGLLEWAYGRRKASPALNREKLAELTAANWAVDIAAARRDLDFRPAYDLEAGVRETVRWYKAEGWL